MLRLISDEDVHDDIIRGLRRREPALDIVRAMDVGLDRTPDPSKVACRSEFSLAHSHSIVAGGLLLTS